MISLLDKFSTFYPSRMRIISASFIWAASKFCSDIIRDKLVKGYLWLVKEVINCPFYETYL